MENVTEKLKESVRRFSDILSDAEINTLLSIQEHPLSTGIRLNPLKTDPAGAIQNLAERYGWDISPLSFYENGWVIQKASQSPGNTIEHRMGQYYLQDAASMVPVSLFNMSVDQPLILDLAASPGGKTTHLIDRTLDRGFILANDSSKSRIPALRSVLSTWGGINQAVTQFPGEEFGSWFPETFDLILLDAPCSMENLRPTPNRPLRETTHDERLRLQERQIKLLSSAICALKPGGQIVYATCSLAPEEDEAVIDALLTNFPGVLEIEDRKEMFPFETAGLTRFEGRSFHPELTKTLRLWPHITGMSGFFCALLTKTRSFSNKPILAPSRDFAKTELETCSPESEKGLFDFVFNQYGLQMDAILEKFNLNLFQRHDQLFLIPESYLRYFKSLPFESIGMCVGRQQANQLELSHEFISRFGSQFTRGTIQINRDLVAQWAAGRDIRYPQTEQPAKGQYLLVIDPDERNLGLGKLLPKRLRNMLPRQSV